MSINHADALDLVYLWRWIRRRVSRSSGYFSALIVDLVYSYCKVSGSDSDNVTGSSRFIPLRLYCYLNELFILEVSLPGLLHFDYPTFSTYICGY